MGQVLHGSATTTYAVRRELQRSQASAAKLARRFGINDLSPAKDRSRKTEAVQGLLSHDIDYDAIARDLAFETASRKMNGMNMSQSRKGNPNSRKVFNDQNSVILAATSQ